MVRLPGGVNLPFSSSASPSSRYSIDNSLGAGRRVERYRGSARPAARGTAHKAGEMQLGRYQVSTLRPPPILSISFSQDGRFFAVAGETGYEVWRTWPLALIRRRGELRSAHCPVRGLARVLHRA
jgi:hypothetical protein